MLNVVVEESGFELHRGPAIQVVASDHINAESWGEGHLPGWVPNDDVTRKIRIGDVLEHVDSGIEGNIRAARIGCSGRLG